MVSAANAANLSLLSLSQHKSVSQLEANILKEPVRHPLSRSPSTPCLGPRSVLEIHPGSCFLTESEIIMPKS